MKYLLITALLLTACQAAETDTNAVEDEVAPTAPTLDSVKGDSVEKDGRVRLRLMTPASEPRACILPIRVENGLETEVNVTMIGFSITGPGEDTTGNMFAPVAQSGEASEARVILEGQSCDAFDTITVPEILCKTNDENCAVKIDLVNGGGLQFSQAG